MKLQHILVILLVLMCVVCGVLMARGNSRDSTPPRPRFETVYIEKHPEQGTFVDQVEVWHDKETGQEIVCVEGYRRGSCYLTGRVWK